MFEELDKINEWYDSCSILHDIATDYRIKSIQSARLKYESGKIRAENEFKEVLKRVLSDCKEI